MEYNFIKDAASLNDFKMLIKTWNGEQCNYIVTVIFVF